MSLFLKSSILDKVHRDGLQSNLHILLCIYAISISPDFFANIPRALIGKIYL